MITTENRPVLASARLLHRAVRAIDHFVHPKLAQNPDSLYRTRVLVGLLITYAALIALSVVLQLLLTLPLLNHLAGLIIQGSTFVLICVLLSRLRRLGNYRFCSVAAALVMHISAVIGIALSGGIWRSSVAQCLMLPPLLLYFFGGVRDGNLALIFTMCVVALFVIAEQAGFHFPQTMGTEHQRDVLQLMVSFGMMLMVSAVAFVYELTAGKLKVERDREHRKAWMLAQCDILTGLANRRSLDVALKERIKRFSNSTPPRSFVLCCLDLNGFKPINDRFGHHVGDEVLRVIAERLRALSRSNDLIGRQGGDEFIAIFEDTGSLGRVDGGSVKRLAERMIDAIGKPIDTSAGQVQVSASLGFAVFPNHGSVPETLRRSADSAMYQAKCAGTAAWQLFDPHSPPQSQITVQPALIDSRPAADADPALTLPTADTHALDAKTYSIKLLDAMLHPTLRMDAAIKSRARVVAAVLLLISALLVITIGGFQLTPLQTASARNICAVISAAALAIMGLLLGLLRLTGHYRFCGIATSLSVYCIVIAVICTTGGAARSPEAQIMSALPLIDYFFGGARWGNAMVIFAAATIALLTLLHIDGLGFPNFLDDGAVTRAYMISGILSLMFTSGIAYAYILIGKNLERERDQEQQHVERLAATDALTGLSNRLKFDADLSIRLKRKSDGNRPEPFALCLLDLNGFKPINDRYGHDVGDEVLQTLAARLTGYLRGSDSVARVGGDEFVLILDSIKQESDIEPIAQRLLQAIAAPISTRAGTVSVGGSLGFAVFPFDGNRADGLKNAADQAMYLAKARGGGWRSYMMPSPVLREAVSTADAGAADSRAPLNSDRQ
jgi:diguanylate cyclase (GGDEF)-like protein